MGRLNAALFAGLLIAWLVLPASSARADTVPSIDEELTVPGWWVVGPFLSGVREAGVDPLAFAEGAPDFETPLLRPSFPSVLVPGGEARWRYYASGEGGTLTVDYPEVPEASMKLVTDEWGDSGANTVGYAYAKLHIEGGPKRALLDLRGAGGVSINGVPWPGDPYGSGAGQSPVLLNDGDNELKVAIGGSQSFSLKFLPVGSDLVVFTQSATLPDLVRGEQRPRLIGLPVANTTTEWMTVTTVEMKSQNLLGEVEPLNVHIPPLCVANLALELKPSLDRLPEDLAGDTEKDKLPLFLILNYNGGYIEVMLELAVKNHGDPRKVTFRSAMDNSVQYYGLLPPTKLEPQRQYGLILSLHGASVEASGLVGAYRPKDWAYVVAPTNRRPFGFDWQDWGQRDMLEVLAEVERTCPIDENRVHLTGHSMGGHGTWLNALTFPDLWASAAPSAGWTRFDLYAPMFLRRNLLYGEPRANYIWQLAMRGDDPLALCENALNLPIFALEGGADNDVPPQQPRLLVERLKQLGYDITYKEVPGMSHWWDDPATPGLDCIDSDELNEFWKSHVRNPWPKDVVLRVTPGHNYRFISSGWVSELRPLRQADDAFIHAKAIDRKTIAVQTVNTRSFGLMLPEQLVDPGIVTIAVDDQHLSIAVPGPNVFYGWASLYKKDGTWDVGTFHLIYDAPPASVPFPQRCALPDLPNVVYGTQGSAEEAEWNLQLARLYAFQWWYRGNGALNVMADTEAVANQDWRGSLICIGSPWINVLRDQISSNSPVWISDQGMEIGGRTIYGSDLTYRFAAPYTLGSRTGLCLVMGGTSLAALKRLPAMMGLYSGAGFPDWMVWDDEVKLKGMGGVLGMGFFDLDWQVDPELSYFNEELIARRAAGD